jgi:hypothetical protein
MEVLLQWISLLQKILHIFLLLFIGLFGWIFFRAKIITDSVCTSKFYRRRFQRAILSNEDTITELLLMIVMMLFIGIVDLRGATFWLVESSVAIAAIVAGTYSDYKEFIYFQF